LVNSFAMDNKKEPVKQFFYSEKEWNRLGCGPLPKERDIAQKHMGAHAKGNPKIDKNIVKGYN
jgi:hypothetical protein